MSSKNQKGSRFAGQLAELAGKPEVPEVKPSPAPQVVPVESDDDTRETFSSHMTRGRKRRLKLAAVREDRHIFDIVGELVEEYLQKNHPDLK